MKSVYQKMLVNGIKYILLICLVLTGGCSLTEQTEKSTSAEDYLPARDDNMHWWRQGRFGMFIHWGPVALKGTEIGWSRGAQVPKDEYDQLYKQFNPVQFNAEEWARVAKEAGMKYIVITSKHHDGFCIWPSKYTEYHIGNSPFKRDVLKELSEACKKYDIRFCTYYSLCDWHHPDYPLDSPGGRGKKENSDMPRYFQYVKDQTKEIIDNYGPLGLMWFDGQWEQPWTRAYGDELYRYLKTVQPTLIINNRVGKAREGMAGTTKQRDLNVGDYDTPEQQVGGFNRERPWETCMTICRQWAWKPDDDMKSLKECIQTLVRVAGGDGNFLFNVGPMPDGRIEPRQIERLQEMGDWLEKYGESIYGTRGGPFQPGDWGASTCKSNKIYLHILNWQDMPDMLPALGKKIVSARLLTGGNVRMAQKANGILIAVPPENRHPIDTIVVLDVEGNAQEIKPQAVSSGALTVGKKAAASNVFQNLPQYQPDKAVDDDYSTRWATDAGTKQAWLDIDLGRQLTFDRVKIREAYPGRIQQFQLQFKHEDDWITWMEGTALGENFDQWFEPITARQVRLNITQAAEGPTIWEFQLYLTRR